MRLSRRSVLAAGAAAAAFYPRASVASLLAVPTVDRVDVTIVVDNCAKQYRSSCAGGVSVGRIHAIIGGFHMVPPQTRQQALDTVAMMQAINPDYIIPGPCSGDVFIAAATAAMPDKIIRSVVGARYQFGRVG